MTPPGTALEYDDDARREGVTVELLASLTKGWEKTNRYLALGLSLAAVILVAINMRDIQRYIRISTM